MTKNELFKLTIPKLREEALKIENITGVHGMDKGQLIEILADEHGINIDDQKKKLVNTAPLKIEAKKLRELKAKAKEAGDDRQAKALQKRIKKIKRATRQANV